MIKSKRFFTLLILVLAAGLLIYVYSSRKSTFSSAKENFALSNSQIDFIQIVNTSDSLTIQFQNNEWLINNQQIREDALNLLVESMKRLESIAPASKSDLDRIEALFKTEATSVKLMNLNRLIKNYYVVFDSVSNRSYLKLNKNDYPVAIKAMGFNYSDLTLLFSTNKAYWAKNIIFDFTKTKPSEIQILFPNQEKVHIGKTEGEYTIKNKTSNPIQIDIAKLNRYINFYGLLTYKSMVNPGSVNLSDENFIADLILSTDMDTIKLTLHKKYKNNGELDFNNLYCTFSNKTGLIEYINIDPLMQDLNYFLKK
jgi:hypothetical protein